MPDACDSEPYLDPNDPHNDTDRSGNHYSNGESRLTPEYEWNGWEKVYRTKKPYRFNDGHMYRAAASTSSDSLNFPGEVTSARGGHHEMEVDSEDEPAAASADASLSPGMTSLSSSPAGLTRGQQACNPGLSPPTSDSAHVEPALYLGTQAALGPLETGPLSGAGQRGEPPGPTMSTRPPDSLTSSSTPEMQPTSSGPGQLAGITAGTPMQQQLSTHALAPVATASLLPAVEEDIFEDASPRLHSRSESLRARAQSPSRTLATTHADPSTSDQPGDLVSNGRMLVPSPQHTTLPPRPSTEGGAMGISPASLRGLRAAARQRVTQPSSQPPSYDVWGFRRAIPPSDGDARSSPSEML